MADPSTTDLIIAGGTAVAAVAAIGAAIFTKRAASASAKAAKAAAEQVELMRPRPLVVATFQHSFSQSQNTPPDRSFQFQNIGASPAFDVNASPIETPGIVPALGAPSRLETEKIPYLLPDKPSGGCIHRLEPQRGGVLASLGPASMFVQDCTAFFDQQSVNAFPLDSDVPYEISFTISYRALDGRLFRQRYRFLVNFLRLAARIEPVGSLLETPTRV